MFRHAAVVCLCLVAVSMYVSFGSKVRPRTFGCVAMGSAVLFIFRSRLLLYSAGSGSEQNASCSVWI